MPATLDKKDGKVVEGTLVITADLPLQGKLAAGKLRSIDGKKTIKESPDHLVVERAKQFAYELDKCQLAREKADEAGNALLQAFQKSKKQRYVKVQTDLTSYIFETKNLTKLVKTKVPTVK